MKAVGYREPGEISGVGALEDIDLPEPGMQPHDLIVEVRAVSVNPVDTKIRTRSGPFEGDTHRVLGFDCAGVIRKVGPSVEGFSEGDEVFYAGAMDRPGTNAELNAVDARIVGHKPSSLSFAEAAALPLTSITAWETLFDRLKVGDPAPDGADKLLIVAGGGGVGSIAIQIARAATDLTVIATASRDETRRQVEEMGAHHVLNHKNDLADEMDALGIGAPAYVFCVSHTGQHLEAVARLIAPQGRMTLIDDPGVVDITPFKTKAATISWEFMFTRPVNHTSDIAEQGRLLGRVADMVDRGAIKTTLTETLGPINAENLTRAHRMLEAGDAYGKLVLEGF